MCVCVCVCVYLVTQLYPTLCDPMDCSPPDFSTHGIFQVRTLEWVDITFRRDLPNPGIEHASPALQEDSLPSEPPEKPMAAIFSYYFLDVLFKLLFQ